uniref:TorF family putative porin n=1 Tax=Pseudomaricurvus sp. TaxID=2004510 RepID=UPI003F6C7991
MKKLTQLAAAVAMTAGAISAAPAMAEGSFSANVGFASEYYYRGIKQKDSSASAGIDYENSGFYVGAWSADVGDGLEVDAYGGWGFETESGFSASVGLTGYYYTGEFDDTYEEVNFNVGYGFASLEYSVGEWDGFGEEEDYDFVALTLEHNGFYGTYGSFGKDFDGEYLEIGYGTTVGGFDLGIAAIFNDEDLGEGGDDDEALVFTL